MPKLVMSSSERVAPGRLHLANFLPVIFVLLLTSSNFLRAQVSPATVTTNAEALNDSAIVPNEVLPLTATVTTSSGAPVTIGTVTFYGGNSTLGTARLNSSGVATLNYVFPPNGLSFRAHFNGSSQAGPAYSSSGFVEAATTESISLSSSGNSSAYTLTAPVTTNSTYAPSGSITFTNLTTGQTLGTVSEAGDTYQSPVTIMPPTSTSTSALGDFNGDGRIDTVSAATVNGEFTLQVNLGNASGPPTQVTSEPFGSSTDSYQLLAVGDFNNDGDADLLVQDTTTNVLTVLLSQGNGQFTLGGQITIPAVTAAVVGDFNNDSNLDLIAASSSGTEFYAGNGAGSLAAGQAISPSAPAAALVADYNVDGYLDFFSYTPGSTYGFAGTSLYLGTGNGTTFTQQPQSIFGSYPPPSDIQSIVTGGFCGFQDYADIAYADNSTVTILCNNGDGSFAPPSGSQPSVFDIGTHDVVRLAAADINNSSESEIVAFVQDTTGPQAPWNMIVISTPAEGDAYTVSAEVPSDSSGVNFPNTPVVFSTPVVGESLTTLSPMGATMPFLTTGTASTATATLSNVVLPPGNNTIVASDGPYNPKTNPYYSNTVTLAGSPGNYTGPTLSSLGTYGNATVSNGVLTLTDGGTWEAGSGFSANAVDIQSFTTTFTFQLTNAQADGFTFTVSALGGLGQDGGYLGYGGGGLVPLTRSVALKFDLFNNAGEGNDSTGVYTDGADPTVPATDMTSSGVNLHSGDVMQAQIIYDGANLHLTLTDTVTGAVFQGTFAVNIPQTIGSTTAYVGFTGATGALTATQQILSWTFTSLPYYPTFASSPSMILNGGASTVTTSSTTLLQMIDGGTNEARSAWFPNPVPITQFTNDFTFYGTNANADGITFTIQNAGAAAVGPDGGGLGYGPDAPGGPVGITNSMAIKFDLYNNAGEGNDSTGIYTNGDSPTVPAIDLSSTGINLHSSDQINVHMVYDGSTITMTLLDTVTNATWSHYFYGVNLPQLVGASTAFIGFTGGTGGLTATEDIMGWTYLPSNTITSPINTY
jgi:hypothetical protein